MELTYEELTGELGYIYAQYIRMYVNTRREHLCNWEDYLRRIDKK